jgi:hypothetical protein
LPTTAHYSENSGLASLCPLIFANIFSVAFGRNLDAHTPPRVAVPSLPDTASELCLEGRQCYVDSLQLTTAACVLALAISVWAGWRDRRKLVGERKSSERLWQEDED